MKRILVTPRSLTRDGHPALRRLQAAGYEVVFCTSGRQPDETELRRLLPGCIGYLAGVEPINATVLEAAKDLRVISRNGVGVDNIDPAAVRRLGITVCKAVGANARGVAELTLAHILSLARWIPFSDQKLKAGAWERRQGLELFGKTLGLIGCGQIGRLVAKLALGLEMKVVAYDVVLDRSFAPSPNFRYTSLDELIEQSDVISLHCPAPPGGKPLIDARALSRMKRGVLLVNTARADLIDPTALTAALEQGHVAGAAMDVFRSEPPQGDPLVAHDRVVTTPHVGAFTEESVDRAVQIAVDNLLTELNRDSRPE